MGGFCPGGFCPRGDFVQGNFVRGGGGVVLEPFVSMLVRLSFSVLCSKSSFVLSNWERGLVSGVFHLSGLSSEI